MCKKTETDYFFFMRKIGYNYDKWTKLALGKSASPPVLCTGASEIPF